MRRDSRQLPLFPPRPTLPSRPFARSSRALDVIAICPCCGHEIVAQRRTAKGEIMSEYRGARGECWSCAYPPTVRPLLC